MHHMSKHYSPETAHYFSAVEIAAEQCSEHKWYCTLLSQRQQRVVTYDIPHDARGSVYMSLANTLKDVPQIYIIHADENHLLSLLTLQNIN